MAIGDTTSVDMEEKRLVVVLDTGVVDASYDKVYVPINSTVTEQQAYDIAYVIAEFTTYTLVGIEFEITQHLGPIN